MRAHPRAPQARRMLKRLGSERSEEEEVPEERAVISAGRPRATCSLTQSQCTSSYALG